MTGVRDLLNSCGGFDLLGIQLISGDERCDGVLSYLPHRLDLNLGFNWCDNAVCLWVRYRPPSHAQQKKRSKRLYGLERQSVQLGNLCCGLVAGCSVRLLGAGFASTRAE